jgi:hypothetical protein
MQFDYHDYDMSWEEMMEEWRAFLRERAKKLAKNIVRRKRPRANRNKRATVQIIQIKRKLIKTF